MQSNFQKLISRFDYACTTVLKQKFKSAIYNSTGSK